MQLRNDTPAKRDKACFKLALEAITLNDFTLAQTYLNSVVDKNDKWRLMQARFYYHQKDYLKAFDLLNQIQDKRVLQVTHYLANCYMAFKNYEQALALYKSIEGEMVIKSHLAQLYRELEQYDVACTIYLAILQKRYDEKTLQCLAECYQEMHQYELAIETYARIKRRKNRFKFLKGLAKCHEKKQDYAAAMKIYQRGADWENNAGIQAKLARLTEQQGHYTHAWFMHLSNMQRFPSAKEVHYECCRFAVTHAAAMTEQQLEISLRAFPNMEALYLLKAEWQDKHGQHAAALATLQQSVQQFPFSSDAYFALIEHYVRFGKVELANQYYTYCMEKFKGHLPFFRQVNALFKKASATIDNSSKRNFMVEPVANVAVPDVLKCLFIYLHSLRIPIWLVGSCIHHLVKGWPIGKDQDIDLVTGLTDTDLLLRHGFQRCPYNDKLFTFNWANHVVDCYVANSYSENDGVFLDRDALLRDFTISSLYGRNDLIYDPTRMGLSDLQSKTLRTIGNPSVKLAEDPIRILRAIRFMVQGFTATPDLDRAIFTWQAREDYNLGHMHAMLKKHMLTMHKKTYVRFLQYFGLLSKLFGMDNGVSVSAAIANIESVVGIKPSVLKADHPLMFFGGDRQVSETDVINLDSTQHRYIDCAASIREQRRGLVALDLAAKIKRS